MPGLFEIGLGVLDMFCLFVYLEFYVPLETFHSFGDVTTAGEGLQIFIYARLSWPLSSEGSLACHMYCDAGHPFILVILPNV